MRWKVLTILVVLTLAGALGAGIVMGQVFQTSQQTSGPVSTASSEAPSLYICEPDSTAGPECGSDDSGADEAIFETDEGLWPSVTAIWDIRLRNVDIYNWDISGATGTWEKISDPGNDCAITPVLSLSVLGNAGGGKNDNHVSGSACDREVEVPPMFCSEQQVCCGLVSCSYCKGTVHIAPGDYEDMRIRVRLPEDAPDECVDTAWALSIQWDIVADPQ